MEKPNKVSFDNISVVLSSCDKYSDAWTPFCQQLIANWPGFNLPLYLNTETKAFNFDGLDVRCPFAGKNLHFKQWSDRLEKLLVLIPTDYILFFLDDFWLTQPVNIKAFEEIYSFMKNDGNIGFICLKREDKEYAKELVAKNKRISSSPYLYECLGNMPFRITTQVGLWKKDYLIKLLRSHESVWYFETRATKRSKYYKEKIYGVYQDIFSYPVGGFLGGGKCYLDYVELYPYSVVSDCIEKRGTIKFGDTKTYPPHPNGIAYYWGLFKSIIPKF